jgi:hypothetical protein
MLSDGGKNVCKNVQLMKGLWFAKVQSRAKFRFPVGTLT